MGNDVYDMISRHKGKYIVSMDLQEQVYKSRFVICLWKNRLWHNILYLPDLLEVYIKHRTTCIEWRRKIILHFKGSDYRRYLSSTRYDMIDSFLMDRDFWVPTFKVECRRLGYVDDLTRWTHGRCYDKRILEWFLGYSTKPEIKNVVSYKWICKIKYVADRSKERIVARGFYKKEGINSEETLLEEARYTLFRTMMVVASMMK